MPEVTKHEPGAFSLGGARHDATPRPPRRSTRGSSAGRTCDSPAGPDMVYTMLQKNGKDVGALYQIGPDQKGMPPQLGHRTSRSPSADDAAKKAKDAGGKILMEPFDVMTFGRMAVIQDPQGAFFSVWEPREHIGARASRASRARRAGPSSRRRTRTRRRSSTRRSSPGTPKPAPSTRSGSWAERASAA